MKKIILVLGVLFAYFTSNAQTITVIDKTTQQPISGIIIYSNNPPLYCTTNSKGQQDIALFKKSDSIRFKMVSFEPAVFTYKQLEDMKFKIEMVETTISLGLMVVSSNRWEDSEIEIPGRIEKLNMKEIAFQNPATTADLLGASGYAYIQKSQLAGGSPMLRGFATNRVMLVVDGVRMNNAIFRAGNLQNVISLDANTVESSEILFGPGAVLYGSDAIGGVMDFHTLSQKFADSTSKLLFTGNAMGRFSSASLEKTGHLDFNIGLKKWAFVTSFSSSDYSDLRAGTKGNSYFLRPSYVETINGIDSMITNSDPSLQVGSGFSQVNFMQKIAFKPSNNWFVDYSIQYSKTSDAPRYDRLYLDANNNGVLDNAQWYYGPQIWMMNRFGISYSGKTKLFDNFRLIAALQNYEESRHDRKFGNKKLRNQIESVDAISLNLDFEKSINDKIELFYGAEAIHNTVGSTANKIQIESLTEEPTNTRYPDGSTWQAYGIYSNLKYKFNNKWIMNTGLRYSFYKINAEFDTAMFPFPFVTEENTNGALNGSIGLVYSPNEKIQMYCNTSTGFRAPNIDDIGKVFDSEPGSVVVPNINLKPEYAYNIEIGAAKIFENFLKIDFAVYYTLLENALARRDFQYNGQDSIEYDGQMSQVQAIQNIAKAYVYGLQAGVDINFGKGIGLTSSINFQKGEEQSEDSLIYYPKPHVAPLFGSTHLSYKIKKVKFDCYAEYNAGMDYEDLPLADRNDNTPYAKDANGLPFVPSWYTLNFKAAYYFNKNISVNVGVENITDQLYRPFSSGISAPGRNYMVAVKASF